MKLDSNTKVGNHIEKLMGKLLTRQYFAFNDAKFRYLAFRTLAGKDGLARLNEKGNGYIITFSPRPKSLDIWDTELGTASQQNIKNGNAVGTIAIIGRAFKNAVAVHQHCIGFLKCGENDLEY